MSPLFIFSQEGALSVVGRFSGWGWGGGGGGSGGGSGGGLLTSRALLFLVHNHLRDEGSPNPF